VKRDYTLYDVITLKQGLLSRTLAGCAAIDPGAVLPEVNKLHLTDLTDERVRKFVASLLDRYQAPIAPEQSADLVVSTAFDLGFPVEYAAWLSLAIEDTIPAGELASRCVNQLMKLAVLLACLSDLQDYAAHLVRDFGCGKHDERMKAGREING
jgi:hypothetical protein